MEVRPTSAIVQLARRRSSDGGDASHESERSFDIGLCIAPLLVFEHSTVVLEMKSRKRSYTMAASPIRTNANRITLPRLAQHASSAEPMRILR